MAKAQKTEAKKSAGGKAVKPARGKGKQALFIVMMILVVIWPTACLLIPAMLPTLVSLITDRDKEKALALTVGATNFAGILPFILQLWQMGQNLDNAMKLMRDPMTWFVALLGAGVGYVIYMVVPGFVATVMAGTAGGRVARMQHNMEELKRIWGPDVATTKQFDEYGKELG
ncbi:MAG: hypothetical protein WBK91_08035 [Alphaproteobacteria bacterium]